MDIYRLSEWAMVMDDRAWSRHTNPCSVYTRIFAGSALFLALWSAHWIGWYAVLPIAIAVAWLAVNPRAFPPATDTRSWATRAVLGERVFMNRKNVPVPVEHRRAAGLTSGLALLFLGLAAYGFFVENFWTAAGGWHAAAVAKLWFCDRMAWLWNDMSNATASYRKWNAADWT